MKDSIPQSVVTGRLLGSVIAVVLSSVLAAKGITMSPDEQASSAELITAAIMALAAAIPPILSKLREHKKGEQ